ncbi:aminotransferase class I/II-fold pyridoxal phosphate-dependent enzyme [Massilia sp. YIM B02769]|uniref:pyridoxal phosphate-dependent aminotransferase n=1 Tax=Massilia sp. YIM B02769 TaxID=3050129 RepID=UPI0025B6B8D8|nr:aminotransferase class I/II-fold pyridoxal phosphate-dependent enzyme [Massilia sp. YIM B02769]MDN4058132.1 aminotransferase class I/II-fold pyridoxal phosphate-dependent enzyme [Massilia sp. YIM B02769]
MKISQRIAHSRPLATTAMHGRVESMRHAGQQVIDFSIAISHFPAPASVLDAVGTAVDDVRTMPYTSVVGAHDVRARLCGKLARENGVSARPDEIIVTNGAKQALYEALYAMSDPGDSVLVFKPHWPAYVATCKLLGLRPVLVDLPDEVTPAFLAACEPARIVIINNPHNPTGKVYSRAELDALRDWVQSTGAQVIVDESYEHLSFGPAHTSLAALCDWRALGVVTIFSASQSYAMMGWRIGFALAPMPLVAAMQTLQGPITAAASHLAQVATVAAFDAGVQRHMIDDYRERRDLVVRQFRDLPWIVMHSPDSGPYLWGDVRALTEDTVGFSEALIDEESVAIMPGDALGVPGFIRIGYISDDIATLMEGVRRVIAFGNRRAAQR